MCVRAGISFWNGTIESGLYEDFLNGYYKWTNQGLPYDYGQLHFWHRTAPRVHGKLADTIRRETYWLLECSSALRKMTWGCVCAARFAQVPKNPALYLVHRWFRGSIQKIQRQVKFIVFLRKQRGSEFPSTHPFGKLMPRKAPPQTPPKTNVFLITKKGYWIFARTLCRHTVFHMGCETCLLHCALPSKKHDRLKLWKVCRMSCSSN